MEKLTEFIEISVAEMANLSYTNVGWYLHVVAPGYIYYMILLLPLNFEEPFMATLKGRSKSLYVYVPRYVRAE